MNKAFLFGVVVVASALFAAEVGEKITVCSKDVHIDEGGIFILGREKTQLFRAGMNRAS